MVSYPRFHINPLMLLSLIYFALTKFIKQEVSILFNLPSLYSQIETTSLSLNPSLSLKIHWLKISYKSRERRILLLSTACTSFIRIRYFSKSYRFADRPCKISHKSSLFSPKPSIAAKSKRTSVIPF